jgi:hypothetical protein
MLRTHARTRTHAHARARTRTYTSGVKELISELWVSFRCDCKYQSSGLRHFSLYVPLADSAPSERKGKIIHRERFSCLLPLFLLFLLPAEFLKNYFCCTFFVFPCPFYTCDARNLKQRTREDRTNRLETMTVFLKTCLLCILQFMGHPYLLLLILKFRYGTFIQLKRFLSKKYVPEICLSLSDVLLGVRCAATERPWFDSKRIITLTQIIRTFAYCNSTAIYSS